MSSTKRGKNREKKDNYPTPSWVVDRFLDRVDLPAGEWLEPGAGDGAIIRAVNARRTDVRWTAIDIRDECREALMSCVGQEGSIILSNFLDPSSLPQGKRFSVGFGNPPFILAQEFIERAREVCDVVALLLRLNFLGSERRRDWFAKNMPDSYVLPNRPPFETSAGTEERSKRSTDSCEYAWMVWRAGEERSRGSIEILDSTPKQIRCPKNIRASRKSAVSSIALAS